MSDPSVLDRPIVILGAPRSGTSMLSQLLRHHPDLYLANEPRLIWKRGNDRRSDMLRPEHATPAIRNSIREAFASQVTASGKNRLLEKMPSNALRVGFVDCVLDGAVHVHILRDGISSVLSIRQFWQNASQGMPSKQHGILLRRLREIRPSQVPYYAGELLRRVAGKWIPGNGSPNLWGPRLPGISQMASDLDLLEVCAMQWRACLEMGVREGRKLPADRYTECQLNEFDRDELVRLMEFCGLSPSKEVLSAFDEKFDASAPAKRAKQFDSEEIARVEELIAPTVAWLATLEPATRHQ